MFELILFTLSCSMFKKIKSKKSLKQIGKEKKKEKSYALGLLQQEIHLCRFITLMEIKEQVTAANFLQCQAMHLAKHSSQRMNDTICLAPCPPLFLTPLVLPEKKQDVRAHGRKTYKESQFMEQMNLSTKQKQSQMQQTNLWLPRG